MDKSKWEYKKLGEVCAKGSSNIILNKIKDNEGDYPLYGATGFVKNIDFYHQDKEYIGIVKDGSGVGRVNIYPAKSSLVGTMQYIIPTEGISLSYLKYFLQSKNLGKYASGAAIPHIYFRDYSKELIPILPYNLQQQIVAELDQLNELISLKQQQLKEYDTLAQSLFYEMVGHPNDDFNKYQLREIEAVSLNIVDCPHSTPIKSNSPTIFPCIRTSELKGGEIKWDSMQYVNKDEYLKRIKRLKPQANDIIYGREGSIGDAVLLPEGYNFCLGQRTMLIRANAEIILPAYLHRALISDWVLYQAQEKNVASTVAHVNVKDFKKFLIPLPPLPLQQSFAERVRAIEQQKALVKQSIAEVQTFLDSRMQEYFG